MLFLHVAFLHLSRSILRYIHVVDEGQVHSFCHIREAHSAHLFWEYAYKSFLLAPFFLFQTKPCGSSFRFALCAHLSLSGHALEAALCWVLGCLCFPRDQCCHVALKGQSPLSVSPLREGAYFPASLLPLDNINIGSFNFCLPQDHKSLLHYFNLHVLDC